MRKPSVLVSTGGGIFTKNSLNYISTIQAMFTECTSSILETAISLARNLQIFQKIEVNKSPFLAVFMSAKQVACQKINVTFSLSA